MLFYLKQSTASQSRMVGPFVDDTDFKSVETALTINNTDVKLSKNGAVGVNKNSGGGTHRHNGMYSLTFDATDSNTVGELEGSILVAGALVVPFKGVVLEEVVYDALFGAGATGYLQPTTAGRKLDVSATGEAGLDLDNTSGTLAAAQFASNFLTAAKIAAGALNDKGNWNIGKTGYALATTPPTAAENRIEMDTNSVDLNGLIAGQIVINDNVLLIPTTPMRGTDGANTVEPDNTGISNNGAAIAVAQLDLDIITGTDGATLATLQPNEDFGAIAKNSALSNFEFLMVLTSDHVTPAPGLTVTGEKSINGGAFAAVAGVIAEVSNGVYQFDALATDTNGDLITWRFSSATADDNFVTFKTVS